VIWQKAAGANNHLERGRVLCVAHSNEKVADRRPEKRFRDMPNEQHTRVARDRVRVLQERPRELADGGVRSKVCLCTAKQPVWNEQAKDEQ
jgi:hypothetical protein